MEKYKFDTIPHSTEYLRRELELEERMMKVYASKGMRGVLNLGLLPFGEERDLAAAIAEKYFILEEILDAKLADLQRGDDTEEMIPMNDDFDNSFDDDIAFEKVHIHPECWESWEEDRRMGVVYPWEEQVANICNENCLYCYSNL